MSAADLLATLAVVAAVLAALGWLAEGPLSDLADWLLERIDG